jgi:HPt (histidine-containing phosphotransfer) domain-containing protein
VDVKKGIAMTGGTVAGYRKVLAQFHKDAQERLLLLQKPPELDALPLFVTQVHALKSASATIGAGEVSKEAAVLEAAGKAGDTQAISRILPEFREDLTELIEGIEKALEENRKTQEPSPQPLSNLQSSLTTLKSSLEAKNMKEIDRLLEEIEKMPLDKNTRKTVNAVSDDVLMGEYGKAAALINAIKPEPVPEAEA